MHGAAADWRKCTACHSSFYIRSRREREGGKRERETGSTLPLQFPHVIPPLSPGGEETPMASSLPLPPNYISKHRHYVAVEVINSAYLQESLELLLLVGLVLLSWDNVCTLFHLLTGKVNNGPIFCQFLFTVHTLRCFTRKQVSKCMGHRPALFLRRQ